MIVCPFCSHSFMIHGADNDKTIAQKACEHLMMANCWISVRSFSQWEDRNAFAYQHARLPEECGLDMLYEVVYPNAYHPDMAAVMAWESYTQLVRRRVDRETPWSVGGDFVFAKSCLLLLEAAERMMHARESQAHRECGTANDQKRECPNSLALAPRDRASRKKERQPKIIHHSELGELLNVSESARYLGVSVRQFRRLGGPPDHMESGFIPYWAKKKLDAVTIPPDAFMKSGDIRTRGIACGKYLIGPMIEEEILELQSDLRSALIPLHVAAQEQTVRECLSRRGLSIPFASIREEKIFAEGILSAINEITGVRILKKASK